MPQWKKLCMDQGKTNSLPYVKRKKGRNEGREGEKKKHFTIIYYANITPKVKIQSICISLRTISMMNE